MINITHEYVTELFANLENNNSAKFFEQVADDVNWEVMGTHPLAGMYHSKQSFIDATFARLNKILATGVVMQVNHIFTDKNFAIVEMKSLSIAKSGKPFNNTYCWVVKFNDNKIITDVRAYVDSVVIQRTIDENE